MIWKRIPFSHVAERTFWGCPKAPFLHQKKAKTYNSLCFRLTFSVVRRDAVLAWCNTARSFEQWSIPNFSNAFSFWENPFFFWPLFQIAFAPQVSWGHHADLARRRKQKYSSIWAVESGSSALARLRPSKTREEFPPEARCLPQATKGDRWQQGCEVKCTFKGGKRLLTLRSEGERVWDNLFRVFCLVCSRLAL